jgi:tRNA modification GTPase
LAAWNQPDGWVEELPNAVADKLGEELIAVEIRVAMNEIGKVAGELYGTDLLERIFSRFCIGK